MKTTRAIATMGALVISGPLLAAETTTQSMGFDECLATIRRVSSELAVAPLNIVETNVLRIVRFVTSDGSVLVSCSEPDRKMIITKSD